MSGDEKEEHKRMHLEQPEPRQQSRQPSSPHRNGVGTVLARECRVLLMNELEAG